MSSRWRPPKKNTKRSNNTANRRAMEDSRLRKLVSELRRRWNKVDAIERGDTMRELVHAGFSTRGLAKEVGQSPTTIRRHLTLASLPDGQRLAVKEGFSAKKLLDQRARLNRQTLMRNRILRERKTGALSDKIADLILDFCRTKDGVPEFGTAKPYVRHLLESTETYLHQYAISNKPLIRISQKSGLAAQFAKLRPPVRNDYPLDHKAEWLAKVIWSRATEMEICKNALEKAKKRAGELEPRRTPTELFREKLEHDLSLGRIRYPLG